MHEKFKSWKLIAGFALYLFFHQIYDILGGGPLAKRIARRRADLHHKGYPHVTQS